MSARARGLSALLAVAMLGAAAGVAGDRAWIAHGASPLASEQSLVLAMRREVGLDPEQELRVRAIVATHQRSVDSAWSRIQPNVHAAINAAQMEIAMTLRPDQRVRFSEWIRSAHRGLPGVRDSSLSR